MIPPSFVVASNYKVNVMKRCIKIASTFLLLAFVVQVQSQSTDSNTTETINPFGSATVSPLPFAKTITISDLKKHLEIIASDDFEGRETGTVGNQKAAEYIAGVFKNMGLPPTGENGSYFQRMSFSWTMWSDIGLQVNGKAYKHLWDFMSFPAKNSDLGILETSEVLFLGYGIEDEKYSDYKKADVKDKVIIIYKGEPWDKKDRSRITGNETLSEWSTDPDKKLELAKSKGVKAVLIIENEIQKVLAENRRKLIGPTISLGDDGNRGEQLANHCYISTNIARELMGESFKKVVKARNKIKKKGKSKPVSLPGNLRLEMTRNVRSIAGDNVLGFVEGNDPDRKEEVVVVTAHYDHLGKRGDEIFNGADDNGSGTSMVLEVAEAFAQAQKQGAGPRRSVLFMLVTGEEKGLLGSKYYSERPLFPIENTVANVNVDMVGRVDRKHADDPYYIYVIGSDRLSTDLHKINERVNQKYTQLTLDYTYNAEDDPNRYYYRSDHYNFAEKGVPAIFYFNGTHSDYHRISDTVDKINFEKMEKIGQLVFHTTWELANRDERIKVDVTE